MELIDALLDNAQKLAHKAEEFRQRAEILMRHGLTADTTISELIKTCDEIGRLNDAIKRELEKQKGSSDHPSKRAGE